MISCIKGTLHLIKVQKYLITNKKPTKYLSYYIVADILKFFPVGYNRKNKSSKQVRYRLLKTNRPEI